MDLDALAEDRGYLVEEVPVDLGDGRTRSGWLVFDIASSSFVGEAVNWTTAAEVEEYIVEIS
jgi:hypothetical protein